MMGVRSAAALLALSLLAFQVRAAETPCPVPDDLALGDIALPAAHAALSRDHRLVVMTLGGAATAGAAAGDADASYPAQLQARLSAVLTGIPVEVVNRAVPAHGTSYTVRNLPKWLAETRPGLVIWGTGAREMARGVDVDAFADALQHGIDVVHDAGADLILLDLQYSPAAARVSNATPYRTVLQGAAVANDLPLLKRYDLMIAWHDGGVLNLAAETPAGWREVARRLFSCMAQVLVPSIAQALR